MPLTPATAFQRRPSLLNEEGVKQEEPVEPACLKMLESAGEEAERRLLASLGSRQSWSRFSGSLVGILSGLRVQHRPSEVRRKGWAYATSFVVEKPVAEAFGVLRRLSRTASLEHGFDVRWSRVLDDDGRTMVRHLRQGGTRDIFCISRCAQVQMRPAKSVEDKPGMYRITHLAHVKSGVYTKSRPVADLQPGALVVVKEVVTDEVTKRVRGRVLEPPGWISLMNLENGDRWGKRMTRAASFAEPEHFEDQEGGDGEQYVLASMSLVPELFAGVGLPQQRQDARRQGHVFAYGVLLTGVASGKCRVDFMSDVDPSALVSPEWMVDREVRLQMLYSAEFVCRALRGFGAEFRPHSRTDADIKDVDWCAQTSSIRAELKRSTTM